MDFVTMDFPHSSGSGRWESGNASDPGGNRKNTPPTPAKTKAKSPPRLENDVEHAAQIALYQAELSKLRRALIGATQEKFTIQQARQEIFDLTQQPLALPAWYKNLEGMRSTGTSEMVPVLVLSDFHWDEKVDGKQTGGLGEYNPEIAARRLKMVIERVIKNANERSPRIKMPGMVACLGGDLVSGNLHDELTRTNTVATNVAILSVIENLAAALTALADRFGQVYVPCVIGNHGRTTKKPEFKDVVPTNYDWLIYTLLEKHFHDKGEKRIFVDVAETFDKEFTIFDTKFLLTHGDRLGVKGGDGIIGNLGPIMRGDKKLRDARSVTGQTHDITIMGHWHTRMTLPNIFVNGSLVGYNEMAASLRLRFEMPQQLFFMVKPEIGVAETIRILAEKPNPKQDRADKNWLSFRAGQNIARQKGER